MAATPRRQSVSLLLCLFLPLVFGCSQKAFMIRSMKPIMQDLNAAVNQNTDVDMLRDALPAFLVQMDGFILAAPNDELLLQGAEAYFGYANAFVEDIDRPRASMLYRRALDYALATLTDDPSFSRALDGPPDAFRETLRGLGGSHVPSLFWAGNSWLAWIGLNLDRPEALMDLPKAQAMLERVAALDEPYYYGSPPAALGALFASQSKALGGDPDKARRHFERAFEISGRKLLLVHVFYARFYAYQVQDRDLFVNTLQEVLDTPPGAFPDRAFANEVARRKAKALLDDVDMYF
jgi:tetratricopeptide (TPR) repeat protein